MSNFALSADLKASCPLMAKNVHSDWWRGYRESLRHFFLHEKGMPPKRHPSAYKWNKQTLPCLIF